MTNNDVKKVTFKIDDMKYVVDDSNIKGSELKRLANLALDERLVININGKPDIDIVNDELYQLANEMKLYSNKYMAKLEIEIDGKKYELGKNPISGKELKHLADISLDGYKLIKEVKNGQDMLIEDDVVYSINDKDMFFAMPTGITNGGSNHDIITRR